MREWKLIFLDMVPSSSADVTRALRGCFRELFVYVSFRFVSKRRKTSNTVGSFFFVEVCPLHKV